METVLGFAVGYLVGTKEGKDGLARLRTSLRAIANSPEARRLATEAVTMAGALAGHSSAKSAKATASAVAELAVRRIGGAVGRERAAAR